MQIVYVWILSTENTLENKPRQAGLVGFITDSQSGFVEYFLLENQPTNQFSHIHTRTYKNDCYTTLGKLVSLASACSQSVSMFFHIREYNMLRREEVFFERANVGLWWFLDSLKIWTIELFFKFKFIHYFCSSASDGLLERLLVLKVKEISFRSLRFPFLDPSNGTTETNFHNFWSTIKWILKSL